MSVELVFLCLWTVAAFGLGVWHLLAAERITAAATERARAGAARYAKRPAVLRPQYANSRPTVRKTRGTGVGFCALGVFGAVLIVRALV